VPQMRCRPSRIAVCLLALGTLLAAPGLAFAAIPPAERAALTALYTSTNGAGWTARTSWRNVGDTDFNTVGTECTWYGVTCDAGQTHVTTLSLYANSLRGPLPAQLGNLTSLQFLYLYSNQLTGSIPPQLGSLGSLRWLLLDNNQLTGSIPLELGNLADLQVLGLERNRLTGAIPPELGSLGDLQTLSLPENQLTGSIPPELGNATFLQTLILSGNQLTGSIPPELGALASLGNLSLASNQLTGAIPQELGSLHNLERLSLSLNRLSGSIPPQLGNLATLLELSLNGNDLTGSIPPQLGTLANLQKLYLNDNHLAGSIPAELGTLASLQELWLASNQLTGGIPLQLGTLSSLQQLWLSSNRLTGAIPAELGNLASLQSLYLQGNLLSGGIPAQLGNLTSLVASRLDLRWNALSTSDATLRAFLNSKQWAGNWEGTQTISPTGASAAPPGTWDALLSWTPILYTGDTGGYQVYTSLTSGGPYTLWGTTGSKSTSSVNVTGLNPLTKYYFVLEAVTNTHGNNQNTVISERSSEVSATTLPVEALTVTLAGTGSGTVTSSPAGIDCGATCSAGFAHGPAVTLTATPAVGSAFTLWGGACTGTTNTCQVPMDGAKSVSAIFTQVAGYYTVTPCRVFDSRDGALGGPHALAAGSQPAVAMAGRCGISPTATGVSLNVTVTTPTAAGHLTLFPEGQALPVVSTINYGPGQTRANNAVAPLGESGALRVFVGQAAGSTHVILDVNGFIEQ
jgi:Leucine-rich repeat (LRR) protein